MIFEFPLEEIHSYQHFEDFLETFYFFKPDLDMAYQRQTFQELAKTFFRRIFMRKKVIDIEANWTPKEKDFRGALKGQIHIVQKKRAKSSNFQLKWTISRLVVPRPPGIEFSGVVPCLLRVYIVRAWDLVSSHFEKFSLQKSDRSSQSCDSYVEIKCANKQPKINFRKRYIPNGMSFRSFLIRMALDTCPVYGQLFELLITIPQQKDLLILVKDNHRLRSGKLLYFSFNTVLRP